jgi:hypothetical protein
MVKSSCLPLPDSHITSLNMTRARFYVDDLDTALPLSLLTAHSRQSGIELDQLCSISFADWVP